MLIYSKVERPPPIKDEPINPCSSSPCGEYAECHLNGDSYSCSCLPDFIGNPPNCRPECISNSECPHNLACINQHCRDPCANQICGQNADCHVVSHAAICECSTGYDGDPFVQCLVREIKRPQPVDACNPNPCGANAICYQQNGAGSCQCLVDYFGNPYEGCRPECTLNSDCPSNQACIRNKCVDPCPGTCAPNANCHVMNHLPNCVCFNGYTGDSYRYCTPIQKDRKFLLIKKLTNDSKMRASLTEISPLASVEIVEACNPNPCGPNSKCSNNNGAAVCSCLPEFVGNPPACRPECVVNSECSLREACITQKCASPCIGVCGENAECSVLNHSPFCQCQNGYSGNAFVRCYPITAVESKISITSNYVD